MIITLTPFPSIEYIYSVEEFEPKKLLTSKSVSLNILSKGIYSAQMMKILQEEPILISSFGGFAGKSIKHYLDKSKIKADILWTDYETPHQVKIILQSTEDDYTLRSQEPFSLNKELHKMTYKLNSHINKVSTLVLSGRMPSSQDPTIFREWIKIGKKRNVRTIVSTGQLAIWEQIVIEKPYAVLLTEEQLNELGFDTSSHEGIAKEFSGYLGQGLHYICIYLKNRGAIILSKNNYSLVKSSFHLLNQNNTASSGAFLGALAVGINRQYEQEKIAKMCLAAALCADDNVIHRICTRKDVEHHYRKTKVQNIEI